MTGGTEGGVAGEIEAIGQMTTAGLAASTFGGPRSRGVVHRPVAEPRDACDLAHGACANCATVLTGAFCAACGQSAHVHRSIGHIVEEFLHGIWHFDSKAWRTLPRLVFAPGRLTRDYVYGKRAGYIAPLGLFLFSIFLMFFVFGMIGGPDIDGALTAANADGGAVAEAKADLAAARSEVAAAATQVAGATPGAAADKAKLAKLDTKLKTMQAKLARVEKGVNDDAAHPATTSPAAKPMRWQDSVAAAARSDNLTVDTGSPSIDARIREALQNPDFALYRIEQKAYKLSFLLIPMSLPVLWLLFAFRRGVHTYDHVVFALYSLSFMSLLLIVIAVLGKLDPSSGAHNIGKATIVSNGIGSLLIFAAPVHMFAQLKGAYRLGTGGALWRTFVLATACVMILGIFAVLIVVVGLAD